MSFQTDGECRADSRLREISFDFSALQEAPELRFLERTKPTDFIERVLEDSRRLPLPPPYTKAASTHNGMQGNESMLDNPFIFSQLAMVNNAGE